MALPHYFDPLSPRGGSAHTLPSHNAHLHYNERGGTLGYGGFALAVAHGFRRSAPSLRFGIQGQGRHHTQAGDINHINQPTATRGAAHVQIRW